MWGSGHHGRLPVDKLHTLSNTSVATCNNVLAGTSFEHRCCLHYVRRSTVRYGV